jgi:hypothetical protein
MNLYGFAGGDPVNFSDPFGLWPIVPGLGSFVGRTLYDDMWKRINEKWQRIAFDASVGVSAGLEEVGASAIARMARYGDEVYGAAKAGGRNSGFLGNYAGRSASELAKAERSLGSSIAEHEGYLANPAEHVENWANLRPGHQQSLINHWKTEIRTANEQIEILRRMP